MALTAEQIRAMLAAKKLGSPAPAVTPVATTNNEAQIAAILDTSTSATAMTSTKAIVAASTVTDAAVAKADIAITSKTMQGLDIKTKLAELEQAMLTKHPSMPVLLRTIHQQLRKDPELVTIISEEEIGLIVNGLKIQTNTEIVMASDKPAAKKAAKKAAAAIGFDDL